MQQLLCNITLLLACLVLGSDAKLRGIKGSRFEELKRKVSNPKGSKYIGKTLKDLGVSRRHLQDFDPNDNNIRNGALQFFSVSEHGSIASLSFDQ